MRFPQAFLDLRRRDAGEATSHAAGERWVSWGWNWTSIAQGQITPSEWG
jgi:hypothetical protein